MSIINRKFLVDAQVWKLNDGEPIELKVDNNIFVLKQTITTTSTIINPKPKKQHIRNVKISYLSKWITKGDFEVFTLDQFFKKFPKQKYNKNLDSHINSLISKKIISQFNDRDGKEKYKINR